MAIQSADFIHAINLFISGEDTRSVYSQYHVKCTEQNVNNQTQTQVLQLYVHISFCLKVIRPCLNLDKIQKATQKPTKLHCLGRNGDHE